MDPFEHLETDSVMDLQVSVAKSDVLTSAEVAAELHSIGSVAGSSVGTLQEVEAGGLGSIQRDIAGADEHFKQVAGNGQVAKRSGPLVSSAPGSIVEVSTTVCIGNPIPVVASPLQLLYIRSMHVPTVGTMPSEWNQFPDPSEL